jgi:hypothetical protein
MAHRALLKLALVVPAVLCSTEAAAEFGPGEAAARTQPSLLIRHVARNADFKVLIWYRRADPLGTFKYQVYDLRKREFTAEVESWIKAVATKHPGYITFVRDVDLKREKGETETLKVGAVIKRELMVAAAISGVDFGGPLNISPGPSFSALNSATRVNRQPGPLVNDRSFLNVTPTPFPVPVPYPRPHP